MRYCFFIFITLSIVELNSILHVHVHGKTSSLYTHSNIQMHGKIYLKFLRLGHLRLDLEGRSMESLFFYVKTKLEGNIKKNGH